MVGRGERGEEERGTRGKWFVEGVCIWFEGSSKEIFIFTVLEGEGCRGVARQGRAVVGCGGTGERARYYSS